MSEVTVDNLVDITPEDAWDLGFADGAVAGPGDGASMALHAANPYPCGELADAYDAGVEAGLPSAATGGAEALIDAA